jgi:predicted peptidase
MTVCKMLFVLACTGVLLGVAPGRSRADDKTTGFLDRTFKGDDGTEVKYVLFVPHNYDAKKPVPAMLFLHGYGECGTDGKKHARVGLGAAIRKREKDFPFLVVFPQTQKAGKGFQEITRNWHPEQTEGKRAIAILDEVMKKYAVDPKRVTLTGLSMGGFGTWHLAAAYPERWAAIVPVCGGGSQEQIAKIKDLPCWCFHGEKDPTVRVELSRRMVKALQEAGGTPKYDEYPGVGHNSWDKAYGTDELYEWLLKQRAK